MNDQSTVKPFVMHSNIDIAKKGILKATISERDSTSALAPEMIGDVLAVRVKLASEEMTMRVVTHETGFARSVAHRVIFMDQGSLVDTGNPHDFFASPRTGRAAQFVSKILTH